MSEKNAETVEECVYVGCHADAVGVYPRGNYDEYHKSWPLCAEHSQQKWHPPGVKMSRFERYATPPALNGSEGEK